MRAGVDYIGVTVAFFCHDGKKNLLLHKRSKNCRDEQGRWDNGGGQLEFGETWEQAVRRELKEEYCISPRTVKFAGVGNVLRENDGKKTHWICIIYAVKVNPKKIKIGEPHKVDEIGWFKLNNLPFPLHSMVLRHLEFAKKYF